MPTKLCFLLFALFVAEALPVAAQVPNTPEQRRTGKSFQVSTKSILTGELRIPKRESQPEKMIPIRANLQAEYQEQTLPVTPQEADWKALRNYKAFQQSKIIGDVEQNGRLREKVKRFVILAKGHQKVPFSPDGPLLWSELEMIRTDILASRLGELLPKNRWVKDKPQPVSNDFIQELTDLDEVTTQTMTLTWVQTLSLNGQPLQELVLQGDARGVNDDGPTLHKIRGTLYWNEQDNYLTYLSIIGQQTLLDGQGQSIGKIEGRFTLTRTLIDGSSKEWSSQELTALTPNESNSYLLFDNPDLELKFEYSRRWKLGQVRGRQISLDGPQGAGILLTMDRLDRFPTGENYRKEVREHFQKRGLTTTELKPLARKDDYETFQLSVVEENRPLQMSYYLLRGKQSGITIAISEIRGASENEIDLTHFLKSIRLH